jgi:hypothetical protein
MEARMSGMALDEEMTRCAGTRVYRLKAPTLRTRIRNLILSAGKLGPVFERLSTVTIGAKGAFEAFREWTKDYE